MWECGKDDFFLIVVKSEEFGRYFSTSTVNLYLLKQYKE